ncbi:MAG TPA: tRNA (adenosine(37)-N6)-dimethylallyltransferase MiaA [Tepidisphaeraceae bacterium]|nr:tRNA (adenosine(37)-N6)-dimethylallyltransferase MiaA [Tepidisphaeraceae bacterium]
MYSLTAIIGPTSSGKSALALKLAREQLAEILCVDSMTVYRHLDIGTAKPSRAEREEVVHHGLDLVDPNESFTVAKFVELADATIEDAKRRDVPLIAVGGTPLYFKSLFEGLFEGPGADDELRSRLKSMGNEALHARLAQVDPEASQRIHLNDTKRLVRALEVYELTGKPITDHQQEWGRSHRHEARWIGMKWETPDLNRRINARAKQMIQEAWIDEVRDVLARFGMLSKTAHEAAGYAEIIKHLQGEQSLDDAIEQIKISTRQLARRQMKWFRRFPNVEWISGE